MSVRKTACFFLSYMCSETTEQINSFPVRNITSCSKGQHGTRFFINLPFLSRHSTYFLPHVVCFRSYTTHVIKGTTTFFVLVGGKQSKQSSLSRIFVCCQGTTMYDACCYKGLPTSNMTATISSRQNSVSLIGAGF